MTILTFSARQGDEENSLKKAAKPAQSPSHQSNKRRYITLRCSLIFIFLVLCLLALCQAFNLNIINSVHDILSFVRVKPKEAKETPGQVENKKVPLPKLQLEKNPKENKKFFQNYPEAYVMKGISQKYDRIIAIGDLHGDLRQFRKILSLCGVVDKNLRRWITNRTILVQTGDIFDRGSQSVEILEYFWDLRHQLQADPELSEHNLILHTLGNHEHLKYHYVNDNELYKRGGEEGWKNILSLSHNVGYFLRQTPIARIVESSLFVHAGIHPEISLLREKYSPDNNVLLLTGENGPIWTRYFESKFYTERMVEDISDLSETNKKSVSNEEYMCQLVEQTVQKLGVSRMIIGHNPQSDGKVNVRCNGQLISIDVGISAFYGNNLGAIEIDLKTDNIPKKKKITALKTDKSKKKTPQKNLNKISQQN
ncbi:serine/threonine protein phosphatase [Reticulomyxa filosa]|uniref:Serine/threonine protein phosphatase n=1 Tax=Reticulomyxa filosa TaxID=46433 RepID=X6N1R9_RETFI|nr:serine/threonine protein phosphatase [Reticulomyxa filosa]|eukprot:ETO20006.1 serine/threonine protein phosphatase [Reticulomyxa filosa]